MASFNETLERMKALYTYGNEVNENKNVSTHSLEYHTIGADGKAYGIIRENNKYYIKTAPKNKEMVAEAYDYIGGFNNKSDYEYKSYSNAFKHIALKMASINEACEANVNITTLDPFKKNEFLVEGTEAMKNEIARQRQIMYNTSMLMNEATEIGAARKPSGVVMFDGKQPEAETGKKGDEGYKKTNAAPDYKGSKTGGVKKNAVPFEKGAKVNEACDAAGCDREKKDWGSVGIGKGEDPKTVGWDMEGQTKVNEGEACPKCGCEPCKCEKVNENEDWASQGLPSTPGVGEADTDHNNDPFNKAINEDDFDDELNSDPEDGEFEDTDDFDTDEPDVEGDAEFELSSDDEEKPEMDDLDDEEDFPEDDEEPEMDDDLEDEDDLDDEDFEDEPEMDDDLEGSEDFEDEDDFDVEDDFEDDEEDFDDDEDIDAESEIDDEPESDFPEDNEEMDNELDSENDFPEDDEKEELNEAKRRLMEKTVKSVTSKILKEDELHVFGKHPGYRKKPMELPSTGEDKNQWGEDWNDESAHSEEPFGSKIGDGNPFNVLVNSITKNVMNKLMEGKKKVK